MKYEEFIEAQKAWDAICGMVNEVANDKSKQLVMPTGQSGNTYWLWAHDMQRDGDNNIIVTFCWQGGGKSFVKDKVFAETMELTKWIFEQYTTGKIYDFYVDCI